MKLIVSILALIIFAPAPAQEKVPSFFSLNGFRNPSIGGEFRYKSVSFHAGYYPTNFTSNVTTEFIKTGVTYWFLPVSKSKNLSSFYSSISYAKGQSLEYKNKDSYISEIGFCWYFYKGFNFRVGVAALAANGKKTEINPTPGISYSFPIKNKY